MPKTPRKTMGPHTMRPKITRRLRRCCAIPDTAAAAVEEYDIKEYEEVPLSPHHATPAAAHADLSESAPFPPVSADASSEAEQRA